eukprot:scaffold29700_cov66-Phaeocystis_antarctica.AAC.4
MPNFWMNAKRSSSVVVQAARLRVTSCLRSFKRTLNVSSVLSEATVCALSEADSSASRSTRARTLSCERQEKGCGRGDDVESALATGHSGSLRYVATCFPGLKGTVCGDGAMCSARPVFAFRAFVVVRRGGGRQQTGNAL